MAKKLVAIQKGFLKSMIADHNAIKSGKPENQTETELVSYLQVLESDYKDCRRYHSQIHQAEGEEDEAALNTYEKEEMMKEIRTVYRTFWTLLTTRINKIKEKTPKVNETQADTNKSTFFHSDLKLPRVELPAFDGKYEDWIPFYNLFTATVHNNSNLEPVQKLHYLLKSVTGEAHKHIRNLTLTDEHYQTAIDLLKDQYDHQRKTAHGYMRKLLDYPTIKTESSNDFKDLLATIKDCSASLEQLNLPVTQWDYVLLCVMQTKIPNKTYRDWEKRLGASRDIPRFVEFKLFLEETFRTLEMVETSCNETAKLATKKKTINQKRFIFKHKIQSQTNLLSKRTTKTNLAKEVVRCAKQITTLQDVQSF